MESEHRDGKYYPWWMYTDKRGGTADYFYFRYIFPSVLKQVKERKSSRNES